jgi:hypothetical protein
MQLCPFTLSLSKGRVRELGVWSSESTTAARMRSPTSIKFIEPRKTRKTQKTVHPEPVEGWNGGIVNGNPFMVRQAHHERKSTLTTNGF